jgi:hypothetical protein
LPVIDHFFSSDFGCFVASPVFPASAVLPASDFLFGSPADLAAIGAAGFDSFPETFGVVAAGAALAVGFAAGGLAANIALGAALCALDVAGGFAGAMGAELLFAEGAPATFTGGFAVLTEVVAGFTVGFAALAEAVAGLIAGFAALAKVVVDLAVGFATLAGDAGFTVGFTAFVCVAGCFAAVLVAGFVSVA